MVKHLTNDREEILATGTPSSGANGAPRSPLQRAHRLPDTPALPKKQRDDVAGGARETRHPVREEHPPGRTGGKQNDTGLSTNK